MARGDGLRRVLNHFRTKKESGDGYLVSCPAHDDSEPSLHISQGRKGVVLKCFAGCDTPAICGKLGLEERELFDDDREPRPQRPRSAAAQAVGKVSVQALARRFVLEEEWLGGFGLHQSGKDVAIPYLGEDGEVLFERRRVRLAGKRHTMQPKGVGLSLYGLEDLPEIRRRRRPAVIFVEGESDRWVLKLYGLPALGVPGASAVNAVLEAQHVAGITEVFVFQEPGPAGENFQLKMGQRLQDLGFEGAVRVVSLRGAKDPAELHQVNPERFEERFRAACKAAHTWSPVGLDDLVVRMDRVQRKEVDWLWRPYIPLSFVTLLGGKQGLGKSQALSAITACVTSGGRLPLAEENCRPSNVLLFSAEDDPEYVLAGRLADAGANLERVYHFDLLRHPFTFGDESFGRLGQLVDRFKPALVAFDPIVTFLGSRVNINRQNEVRGVLQPLISLAKDKDVAVLLVAHVSKGTNLSNAMDAVMGSGDFTMAPRSVLIAYPDPDLQAHQKGGVLAQAKCNLAREGKSLRFVIEDGRYQWAGPTDITAAHLAGAQANPAERGSLEEAVSFLREELLTGERLAKDVLSQARRLGISNATLARARWRLGVRNRRQGFGPGAAYYYSLPADDGADSKVQTGPAEPEDLDDVPI